MTLQLHTSFKFSEVMFSRTIVLIRIFIRLFYLIYFISATNGACPNSDWTLVGGTKCFLVATYTTLNNPSFASNCGAFHGGTLGIIESEAENTAVQGLIPSGTFNGMWLGCTDFNTEGTWACSANQQFVEGGGTSPTVTGYWSKYNMTRPYI